MSSKAQVLILNNIKLPLNASHKEAFLIAEKRLKKCGINTNDCVFAIYKRSIDARNKNDIRLVYSISVENLNCNLSENLLETLSATVVTPPSMDRLIYGDMPLQAPPIVVGAGPCGLFAALLLAENGYAPIIIERGGTIKERNTAIAKFHTQHILDDETNIQFGAGGAGTFSDGKLVTRVNDPVSAYVLKRFVEFGAPREILYQAKPHVGTDILSEIIDKMIEKIVELGGKIHFHTKFLGATQNGMCCKVRTSRGEMTTSALVLAIGHSARDTYAELLRAGYSIQAKPFSVGMRIEHLATTIDTAMFGAFAGNSALGHAEYNLSHNTKQRGVYTFCMCPGGEVVAAASEQGGTVVNGMSKHARANTNSNSAVVCSIFESDYGATPEKAIEFQRNIEKAAFNAGGGDFCAPIITVGDFLNDTCSREPYCVMPTYMGGKNVKLALPSEYLPSYVCSSIKNALLDFDKKIRGFADSGALLTGAETRTSAPVRILRDSTTRLALGTKHIYPCGEGAGYAGGITSAAIDGIKTAIKIINQYKPF